VIADLKPYPEYKESGLPWLGQVPVHWEVTRLGAVGRFSASGIDKKTVPGEPLVRMINYLDIYRNATHMLRATRKFMTVSCPPEKTQLHSVRRGDLFFTPSSETSEDIGHSAVAIDDIENAVYSYHVIRFRPARHVDVWFSRFWCNNPPVLTQFSVASRGTTRKILDRGDFRGIVVVLPPPEEQALIGQFLDWATGRLERAIRAKRKVIALLNEQKQAIIHRAVTRGLDPSVPLKPSGVPWLGSIPQHWSLKRFKFLATINSGQVDPRKAEYRDLVLIAPNHIQSGSGRLVKQETATEQGADSGKYLVRRGQVIYSKIRPNLRKAAIAPCDCLCSADMYPIAPTTGELSTDYLLLLLLSQPFTKFAVDTSMRVAMPKVNREALANCLMWYPGAEEQSLILEFVAREAAPLETAISRLEREIGLLREYRTRLVADVVTGKLDVREAAVRLPAEIENVVPDHEEVSEGNEVVETEEDDPESPARDVTQEE
jgi:type I restriction enzyme S subunit